MAKIIKYNLCTRINHGTEEEPKFEEQFYPAEIPCETQAIFDANYPIAEKEAVPGSIEVTGEFGPEPVAEPTAAERIEALEAAMLEMMGVAVDG